MVKDLVCGMEVDEKDERAVFLEFSGEKYYFCCIECKLIFSHDQLSFIKQSNRLQKKALDGVCGMELDGEHPPFKLQYHGRRYYFCSQSCLREFERNPQRYLNSWTKEPHQGENH
jgi:Cu+-exporting ATPase